jgi:hypothetical protein
MITKKTYPVGTVQEKKGERFMRVEKTIAEYRILGILFYKKEIVSPHLLGVEYWDEYYPNL